MWHHHLLSVAAAVAAVALLAPGAASYPWPICGTDLFRANSAYQTSINLLAATLPGNASTSPSKLFATAAAGAAPARVWAAGLCRGDVNATDCSACLAQAFVDLQNDCSYSKEGSIYYDACSLCYASVPVLSDNDTDQSGDPIVTPAGVNVTSHAAEFNRVVAALVKAVSDYAARNSTLRFATGEAGFELGGEVPKVYAVAQCTPDLTPRQCRRCLARRISKNLGYFENAIYGRLSFGSCNFRYEINPFFNGPAMVRLPSPFPAAPAPAPTVQPTVQPRPIAGGSGDGEDSRRRKFRVPVVVPAVLLPVLAALNLVACLCFWRRRWSTAEAKNKPYAAQGLSRPYAAKAEDTEMVDSMMMDVSTLRTATGDFDETNKLGEGGFGAVYKGVLPDGEEIAVKRLSQSSTQGLHELKNELQLVAKLSHKNLVRFVGFCLEQQEWLLVYEYVPNRSLDLVLFGSDDDREERREQLDWEQRYRIINGIARGLQYLHEDSQLRVVHRDLKASNILLDAKMNPKISDFGIARIFSRDETQAITSSIVGTHGYMAPEYVMRGNYSVKSDAFSFGVIVLEIVTGRKNGDCYDSKQSSGDLLNTVWEHWEAGTVMELADPSMNGSFPQGDLMRCFHIGLLCVQADPAARPEMSSVVMMLGSDTVALQAPCKPAFFARKGGTNANVSTVPLQG